MASFPAIKAKKLLATLPRDPLNYRVARQSGSHRRLVAEHYSERAAMDRIRVIYHHEPEGWWAESPDLDGWSAAGDTYDETRRLAEDGVRFALDRNDVQVEHYVPERTTT